MPGMNIKTTLSHLIFITLALFSFCRISPALEWTDPALSKANEVRARHILELRANVNNKRLECGMSPYTWSETAIIPKTTPIRATHIGEIRTGIKQIANQPPARTAPTFSDNLLVGETAIRYEHIQELRTAIENATCCGDGACDTAEGETETNCAVDCLCTYTTYIGSSCGESTCDESSILITKVAPEPGCPTLYSCEAKPSVCCTVTYNYLGCGDNIHCGPTQRMTERLGLGCTIPESDRYICGPDESCCEYITTDLGCGATADGVTYPYYTHVYFATDQLGVCEDKIATLDNEADCCSYIHKESCGDPTCGLSIYNKTIGTYEQCATTATCPAVPTTDNIYFICDYSEAFPTECAPHTVADVGSPNCCNYVETPACIDHVAEEGGVTVTRIGTDKQVTKADPANPDCAVTVTVVEPPFHNDCCQYNTVQEICVAADATETTADTYTKRVRQTVPTNTECPNQEEVVATAKDPTNPCCKFADEAVYRCGGQCNNRGPVYPESTRFYCHESGNLSCPDVVKDFEENSDLCCKYDISTGCALNCAGVTYGPNQFVTCKRPTELGCSEVVAVVEDDIDTCCHYVVEPGCGLTCAGTSFGPGVFVKCQRSSVAGCPETVISQEPASDSCCNYTTPAPDCGLTCAGVNYPQSDLITCKKSSVAGCPETLINQSSNDNTCCQYTTYAASELGCGKSCGTETNDPGTKLEACIISATGYCSNTHTRTSASPTCCNYQYTSTAACGTNNPTCADAVCGISCGATTHNPNERVWCRTSIVTGCTAAAEVDATGAAKPHAANHADCCQMILNPANSTGCGKTCNGVTYNPLDRVTKCYYSTTGRCNTLNDIQVVTNDTTNCCIYTLDASKSGCGKTCNSVTYEAYEQIECRTTAQTGCQAEKATLISTGTDCCNYVTTSDFKANLAWVTNAQAAYPYCRVTYRTSTVAGCSTPVFVSADCSATQKNAYCGFSTIYNNCGPYTCGTTSYLGKDFVTCYQATLNISDPYCATYGTVTASKESQCCAYADYSGCGTDPSMAFCLGGPYPGSTYLTCRESNENTGCSANGAVIGTPATQSPSCCNYSEQTQCGLTCPPLPATGGTTAEDRLSVYCKWDPSKPSCTVTRTATPSDACCNYTSTAGCGLTCNSTAYQQGSHVTCYSSAVSGCTKAPTVVNADPACCNYQTVEGCGITCEGTTYDPSQWVSCRTSIVDGCPASTLNTSPIEDDPRCCSFDQTPVCGGTCEGVTYDTSVRLTCRTSAVTGCPASSLLNAIEDDPVCCNFTEDTTCGGNCEGQNYDASQLITCKRSSVAGCPASTLVYGPEDNTQSCCQWGSWTTTPNGGCGATLPESLQSRVFTDNPITCSVLASLEIRYPIANGCSIYTQCTLGGCAECIFNASDALNEKQACALGGSCSGIKKCQPNNQWGPCEYTVCTPGSKLRCDYLETTALDPYAKLDYKICNSCGTGWSECSCGQNGGLAPWDQVDCYSAYPPCYTDTNHPTPCPTHAPSCPGLRVCTASEWQPTCNWRETYCTPGDAGALSCKIQTPDGIFRAGKTICNACGTDVIKVANTAVCYCFQDIIGCDTGIPTCEKNDGVFECDPVTGQFSACQVLTEGTNRCTPGETATCTNWIGMTKELTCTDCGRWDKKCNMGTITKN